VTAVNGNVYAIGGTNIQVSGILSGPAFLGTNEEYSPVTDTWVEKAAMPTPRDYFAIAAYGNEIYAMGGEIVNEPGRTAVTNVNEVYDTTTNTWSEKAPVPITSSSVSANVVDGKIYLMNGYHMEVYDPATDTWTMKADIPTIVTGYSSAVVNNKIYVISGSNSSSSLSPIGLTQIYDPATDQWTLGAPIPIGVVYAAAGAITGTSAPPAIYVVGGTRAGDPSDATNLTQVYFPDTNSWSAATSMPINRASLGVAVVNDTLYAIGGAGNEFFSPMLNDNEQYTPVVNGNPSPTPSLFSTASPSPPPSVPEMPWFVIVAMLPAVSLIVAMVIRRFYQKAPSVGLSKDDTSNSSLHQITKNRKSS
jgi:hypothetical protein